MADSPAGYPVMLNMQDKYAAVIGGGTVATRKVKHLLAAGARVLVISPRISADLQELADCERIEWRQAEYQRDMLNDFMPLLVIAAADDERANRIAAQDARRIRALSNLADGAGDSDFSNMALIDRAPLTIALSANGSSPALLRQLKTELDASIGAEYATLSRWLGDLRQPLQDSLASQAERKSLFERVLASDALALLRDDQCDEARQVFQRIVDEAIDR